MISLPLSGPAVVRRHSLPGSLSPAQAVALVADDEHPVVLCGEWAQASAIVASEPLLVIDGQTDAATAVAAIATQPDLTADSDRDALVGGGWLGFLGYPTCAALAGGPPQPPQRERLADHMLAFYDHLLVRDDRGRWWLEQLWTEPRSTELDRRLRQLTERLQRRPTAPPANRSSKDWRPEPSTGGHARAVDACLRRIDSGDLFQANLALRLRSELAVDPAALFAAGVDRLTPQRACFCSGPWGALVSLSPELLVSRHGRDVMTAPIKGTRPRPADDLKAAESMRLELASSEKDRAENTMIVDLMRNDLGRVCRPGSIVADPLCAVRPMAGVWHLVSEIRGRLRDDCDDAELALALLPAGSVTGAPKHAALAVIAELESAARQAFCGSALLASPLDRCELSVLIRSFELAADGNAWLDVGGGITAGSDGAAEARECLDKARPLLATLGPPHHLRPPTVASPQAASERRLLPPRLGPRPLARPAPAAGIFTTIRVVKGSPQLLGRHIDRLAASAAELYGPVDAEAAAALAQTVAAEHGGDGLLRLIVDAACSLAAEIAPAPPAVEYIDLAAVCLPGGLGAHKWRDRTLLEALERFVAPAQPLIVDLDGGVLEASRWTIIATFDDGALVTPAADDRILPGVMRAELLGGGERPVAERPLTLAELQQASSIVVANALRGIVPVRSLVPPPAT